MNYPQFRIIQMCNFGANFKTEKQHGIPGLH